MLLLRMTLLAAAAILGRRIYRALRQDRTPIPAEALITDGALTLVAGTRLHVRQTGAGRPVVLVGGPLQSTDLWSETAAALTLTHRLIAVDPPGCGLSDKPFGGDYSPAAQARAITELLTALNLEPAILVAASTGARIALETAIAAQGRVSGVMLLAPVVSLPPQLQDSRVRAFLSSYAAYALASRFAIRIALRYLTTLSGSRLHPAAEAVYLAARTPGFPEAFLSMAVALAGPVDLQRYSAIQCPVRVMYGLHDPYLRLAHAASVPGSRPDGGVSFITRCGHLPHVEAPVQVASAIAALAREIASGASFR